MCAQFVDELKIAFRTENWTESSVSNECIRIGIDQLEPMAALASTRISFAQPHVIVVVSVWFACIKRF
jgi:hypothetical protein